MIELFVLGATLTVAAWGLGARAHRRYSAVRALDAYARSRGFVFIPPPNEHASPRVLCVKEDSELIVDLYRLAKEERTRVSMVAARGCAPVLSVLDRKGFHHPGEGVIRIGDADFDAAFVIAKAEADDADRIAPITATLLGLCAREGVWLASDGHKVSMSWRGFESDPVILDAACDVVAHIATQHRSSVPYR